MFQNVNKVLSVFLILLRSAALSVEISLYHTYIKKEGKGYPEKF